MDLQALLPDPERLNLHTVHCGAKVIRLDIRSQASSSTCPACGTPSQRVHSHYDRVLKDLACFGRKVCLHLTVRRFFCDVQGCSQRIFCERLPSVAAPWQRATVRFAQQTSFTLLEVGAEGAARVLRHQGLPTSADALLASLRRQPAPGARPPVRHLGIDDWAWRKGHTYGTILVDLDQHRTIDVLPNRDVSGVVAWLGQHPEIEVVTRDRSGAYQEAVTLGAPQAQQVADRWHLLKNVQETLERFLLRVFNDVRVLFQKQVQPLERPAPEALPPSEEQGRCPPTPRALARFTEIKRLQALGHPVRQIARQAGVALGTARKYLRLDACPGQPQRRRYRRALAPHVEWLRERWKAGDTNAVTLYEQLKLRGYRGGYSGVRDLCRPWRDQGDGEPVPGSPTRRCPTARTLSWMLLCPERVAPELVTFLESCRRNVPTFGQLEELVLTGWRLLRTGEGEPLRVWLRRLTESQIPELERFAVGLDRDFEAVRAAVETRWSNGQVEGQVNRLKTLKRTMYGRAGMGLLRARVLHTAR